MTNNSLLLTIAETAAELRVSKCFLYRLAKAGILPTVRLGRRCMVRRSDIMKFIQSGTNVSTREAQRMVKQP